MKSFWHPIKQFYSVPYMRQGQAGSPAPNTSPLLILAAITIVAFCGLGAYRKTSGTPTASSWVFSYSSIIDGQTYEWDSTAAAPTIDGGYIVAGRGLMKLNASGIPEWHFTLGYECQCYIADVVQNSDAGFTAAVSRVLGFHESWIVVFRTDSLGNLMWSKRYRRTGSDSVQRMIATRDGGYLVAGRTNEDRLKLWLLRLSRFGNIHWQKTYNVAEAGSLEQLADGDFLIGTKALSLLRLSPKGDVRWQRKYVSEGCCFTGGAVALADGGYILAGGGHDQGFIDLILIKADPTGSVDYSMSFPRQEFVDIITASNGGVVLLTNKRGGGSPVRISTMRLSPDGKVLWRKFITDPKAVVSRRIITAPDGGFILIPTTRWIMKLDESANIVAPCRRVFAPLKTVPRDATVKVQIRTPTVLNTTAIPVNETLATIRAMPLASSICGPQ